MNERVQKVVDAIMDLHIGDVRDADTFVRLQQVLDSLRAHRPDDVVKVRIQKGEKVVGVIKALRTVTGVSLKDAKDTVCDGIVFGISRNNLRALYREVEQAGGKVVEL